MRTEPNEFPAAECPPALALIGVSLCEAGRALDGWSRLLFVAAILPWLAIFPAVPPPILLALTAAGIAFAGIEAYHALRLAFDRPVFAGWARCGEETLPEAMQAFDAALAQSFGRRHASGGHRSLIGRVQGARRLFFRQAVCFAGQVATLLMSLAVLGVFRHDA
jgi:hypothetical protein